MELVQMLTVYFRRKQYKDERTGKKARTLLRKPTSVHKVCVFKIKTQAQACKKERTFLHSSTSKLINCNKFSSLVK